MALPQILDTQRERAHIRAPGPSYVHELERMSINHETPAALFVLLCLLLTHLFICFIARDKATRAVNQIELMISFSSVSLYTQIKHV